LIFLSNPGLAADRSLILFEENPPFKHYASELLSMLGMETYEEIMEPLERARQTCLTMGIPEEQHFKQVYRFSSLSMSLRPDYQLTPLATYLVTVNSNPANINVAKAQVFFFMKFNR
jgi:DNA-damage-inducible protein D